ncbi:MAG TPA: M61 family peptidase [Acidobacteriaceae bacterium]|nr:M61 family peptidase [Acidobacteriaceae bacterium]
MRSVLPRITGAIFAVLLTATALAQQTPIQVTANLTDGPRKLYHSDSLIPVKAGPLDLITPEWIPGTHQPYGPAKDIVGVKFTANGKTLPWRRDDVDLFEFHLTIPPGVTTLHAHLDCIVTSRVSQKIAVLEWERLMIYPAHIPVKDIPIQPSLVVPAGWGVGTALTPISGGPWPVPAAGATTKFAATTVEQLEDSPIIAGQYFHEFALAPDITPKHYIDVVSDFPKDSNLSPQLLEKLSNLVREASAAYGSHHYHEYHFLLTLSDVAGGEGLEHGQSSDNGTGEKGFSTPAKELSNADLLSHEFTHSWNGKYRRPAHLYQPDFATPQWGRLLWVYEGMTQYLGNVLAARSGLKSQAQYRDMLASSAANLEYKRGRDWRDTEDTAVAASIIRHVNPPSWNNWRRGQDYYQEGELVWLDADTLIRQKTNNKKSLTDFLHIFLGKGGNTGPLIVPYTFDELCADLNQVLPYDWAKFFHDRVYRIDPHADLDGIERGGYKLVFTDKPSASSRLLAHASSGGGSIECWYSIGLRVNRSGVISDVLWHGPADNAGISPTEKIIAVNGQIYSPGALKQAIIDSKTNKGPIHLILQADTYIKTADIDYHGGERYPRLERVSGTPDYLDDITTPLVKKDDSSPIKFGTENSSDE